jgi:diguanylate cyclase (GGDEF)-like protein
MFLETQLDFIFFFYGLAFLLLGIVCFSIAKTRGIGTPWTALGLFGLLHGSAEWLDLGALIFGDTPGFAAVRVLTMTASFVLLMEFSRLEAILFGFKAPGRWIHLPLIAIVALPGLDGDMSVVAAMARYTFGFCGGLAVSLVFARHVADFKGPTRRLGILSAVLFAVYAVAAGIIVPAAPLWPATIVNQTWFLNVTGVPIQFVRGLLACGLAFCAWAIWGRMLVAEVSSEIYTAYMRRLLIVSASALLATLVLGWCLTEFLGGIYRENVEQEAVGDIDLLASRLSSETTTVNGVAKMLAGSPSILPLFEGGNAQDRRRARTVLDLHVEASDSVAGVLLDTAGTVIASSGRDLPVRPPGDGTAAWAETSMAGHAGYHFDYDPETGMPSYAASYPVRSDAGTVVGLAIMQKSLDAFGTHLLQFGRPYFLINPDGIVVLTNRPGMLLRTMWPLAAAKKTALAAQFGALERPPLLGAEIIGAQWTKADGKPEYISRQFIDHSQWSLVIAMPSGKVFASRVLGIIITLLVTVTTLTYFVGKEFGMRENIQLERRLQLQELARDLRYKATTDPLTGLYNRLKFNEAVAGEIARATRYGTPLSLMIYDVDHFKEVNDVFGHQAGDSVLVRLSEVVAERIRATDILARWGGEEFVILTPNSDGDMAFEAAAKLIAAIKSSEFDAVGTITCSFGVAQFISGDSAETLVARADNALYRAKMNGRNCAELAPMPDLDDALAVSIA